MISDLLNRSDKITSIKSMSNAKLSRVQEQPAIAQLPRVEVTPNSTLQEPQQMP